MEKFFIANSITDDENEHHGYLVYEVKMNELQEDAKAGHLTYGKLVGHFRSLRDFSPVVLCGSIVVGDYTLEDLKAEIEPHQFQEA